MLDGQRVEAMVYIMQPGFELAFPMPDYYETLAQGYQDCGLDMSYLKKVTQQACEEYFEAINRKVRNLK